MRKGLIAAREAKGWTQQRLADEIQKDRSTVTHYESGDYDIPGKMLRQLSQVLNTPMDKLYVDTPKESPEEEPARVS